MYKLQPMNNLKRKQMNFKFWIPIYTTSLWYGSLYFCTIKLLVYSITRIRCEGLRYECFTTETVDTTVVFALDSEQKSSKKSLFRGLLNNIFVVTQKSTV